MFSKSMIALVCLLVSNLAIGEIYVGGSLGTSNLNFDPEKEAYKYLATDGARINGALDVLGGNLNLDTDTSAGTRKLFVGYNLNKYVGFEAFYMKIDEYTAQANYKLNNSFTASSKYQSNVVYAKGDADYKASVGLKGYGIRVNGYAPLTDKFSFMGGVSLMRATSTLTTSGGYSYDVGYDDNSVVSGSERVSDSETQTVYLPILSVGGIYRVTNLLSVRAEIERMGHPIDAGLNIDMVNVGVQFHF